MNMIARMAVLFHNQKIFSVKIQVCTLFQLLSYKLEFSGMLVSMNLECSWSNLATYLWPFTQASINAVDPSLFIAFNSMFESEWSRSNWTTALCQQWQTIINAVHPPTSLAFRSMLGRYYRYNWCYLVFTTLLHLVLFCF